MYLREIWEQRIKRELIAADLHVRKERKDGDQGGVVHLLCVMEGGRREDMAVVSACLHAIEDERYPWSKGGLEN